jgi:hypothetical protein
MGVLRNPVFLTAGILFTLNQYLEKVAGIFLPYVHEYLDDVLCMPVVLTLTLFIQRKITFRNEAYTFTAGHVMVAVVYFSLMFEGILPAYSPKYTRDWLDIVAYAAGAAVFYRYINFWRIPRNLPAGQKTGAGRVKTPADSQKSVLTNRE